MRGHVAQANHHDRRQFVHLLRDHGDLVGGAEQKWPVDAEDGGVVGDVFVLQDMHASVFDVVAGDLRDGGGRGHAADEEQCGQDHSGFDGNGKIGEDGQRKSHQPYADVGLGQLAAVAESRATRPCCRRPP